MRRNHRIVAILACGIYLTGCNIPTLVQREEHRNVPATFDNSGDTSNTASISWRQFFGDHYLADLIDTAIHNNQELQITLQEIEIARNEVRARKGEILPSVGFRAGAGLEKVGRYTSQGAGDAATEIEPGKEMPDPLPDFGAGLTASWEVDIWKKLRNARKAAVNRYLSSIEGKNFVLTNLVAEVADSYYELLALDNSLQIVKQNIGLQQSALEVIKVQKDAARATELAVQKFEAEVAKSSSLEFDIRQQIVETENRINLLLARYPQPIPRDSAGFLSLMPAQMQTGLPSQLLTNRPDIRQAELELAASKLDVKVARAAFLPGLGISAGVGLGAFNPAYFAKLPESIVFNLAGELAGPLINRNAIKAGYYTANARQQSAVYRYERSILTAYLEVSNGVSRISNLDQSYRLKSRQVEALTRSIDVAGDLFKSARADYLEVLTTQRDVLEAKLELVETKKNTLTAAVDVYKALGGGWR